MSAYAWTILGTLSSMATQHDDAVSAGLKAVEYDPEAFASWHWLATCYQWAGDLTAALKPFTRALEISGRHIWTLTSLVVTYSDLGRMREANVIYNELLTKAKLSYVSPACMAIASAALGKNDEAMRFARQAYDRRDPFLLQGLLPHWPNSKQFCRLPEYPEFLSLFAI